jgi:hypothetical protein
MKVALSFTSPRRARAKRPPRTAIASSARSSSARRPGTPPETDSVWTRFAEMVETAIRYVSSTTGMALA